MEAGNQGHSVNASNFLKLAQAYVAQNGGFLLAMRDGENQGVEFTATQRQWGAWRAYFKARGIKTGWMDAIAQTSVLEAARKTRICLTVPSAWPHEFDREATVQGDHEAADAFMRHFRPESPRLADAARRAVTVAAYRKWKTDKPRETWKPEPETRQSGVDLDALMAGYEKDLAEDRARREAKAKPPQKFNEAAA